jgi:hypothetical protein
MMSSLDDGSWNQGKPRRERNPTQLVQERKYTHNSITYLLQETNLPLRLKYENLNFREEGYGRAKSTTWARLLLQYSINFSMNLLLSLSLLLAQPQ